MQTKITPVFYGQVTKGELILEKPDRYKYYLQNISGPVMLTLKRPKKPRSNNQNAYYWDIPIQMIADHTGMTPDETHEAMKFLFLKKHVGSIVTVRSSATLNTLEFEEFTENIRRFASSELNIYIPLPNEVDS